MALTNKSAAGAVIGIGAAIVTALNPNFDPQDITDLGALVGKWTSDEGFIHSGLIYVAGATATVASVAGLAYNTLRGRLYKRK